jgi:hypothetical protein
MRSFQQALFFFFALVAMVFAEEPVSYDETVTLTSTIYNVNTVTLSGYPTGSVTNSTSTISAYPTHAPTYSVPANSTVPYPTGTGAPTVPQPTPTDFPGAASGLSVNGALVAAFAAGIGYLAL